MRGRKKVPMRAETPLWQIVSLLTKAAADTASRRLEESGALAVSLMDEKDGWRLSALFARRPRRAEFAALLGGADFTVAKLAKRDWVKESGAALEPVRAGRFVVATPERAREVPAGSIPIVIAAGLAFGTGHHGSTQGCLMALDWLARRARPARILDLGTGSGVLAIAAAKCWRARTIAVDIDTQAVATARANIDSNRIGVPVRMLNVDGFHAPELRRRFDLVLANILARPLIAFAPALAALVTAGGHAVLSGFLAKEMPSVLAAYRRHGFCLRRRLTLDDWTTLVLGRGSRLADAPALV